MIERTIDIPTRDGPMTTFITHPERDGPYPVVMLLSGGSGFREDIRDQARRIASVGYYAMVPNLFHRNGVLELVFPADREQLISMMQALVDSLDMDKVCSDGVALLAYADGDPAASKGKAGAVGYCMSGQWAIGTAARHPQRIGAAASFYGVGLITDSPDSPHLAPEKTDAELYFGFAEFDDWVPLSRAPELSAEMQSRKANAEIEIYYGAHHGFVSPEHDVYCKWAAERHYERLFSLFRRGLRRDPTPFEDMRQWET